MDNIPKICTECRVPKPRTDFYPKPSGSDGLCSKCKRCISDKNKRDYWKDPAANLAAQKIWRRKNQASVREGKSSYYWRNKEDVRARARQTTYGISPIEFRRRMKSQGGVCAICGKPPGAKSLHVDHCHLTKAVRGLLCTRCNTFLGMAEDREDRLKAGLKYLRKARIQHTKETSA